MSPNVNVIHVYIGKLLALAFGIHQFILNKDTKSYLPQVKYKLLLNVYMASINIVFPYKVS